VKVSHFKGRVKTVVFRNDAQSFYVLSMLLEGQSEFEGVTVRGNIPGLILNPGVWFGFDAHWETHKKFGRQLVIDRAPVMGGSWDPDTALKMLASHGVGQRTCDLLKITFGADLLNSIDDLDKLMTVPGMTQFSAQHVQSRWNAVRALFQSLEFLSDLKLPKKKVNEIYAHFSDNAEKILSQDPWRLVEVDGITFDQADEVARRLGLVSDIKAQLRGAALYALKSRRGLGHLYLSTGDLVKSIQSHIPEATKTQIATTLKQLSEDNLLVVDQTTRKGTTAIYEPWFYQLEVDSANLLANRCKQAEISSKNKKDYAKKLAAVGPKTEKISSAKRLNFKRLVNSAVSEWCESGRLTLSDTQLEGAVRALSEPVSVLTGLPGTGKTTTLKVVVKILQEASVPFLLVAPTGIAAKRLHAVTGAEAFTIHRAFGASGLDREEEREAAYSGVVEKSQPGNDVLADGSREAWGFNANEHHPAEVVIIDESSMVDQHLLFRVLTCTKSSCRIVFVGDAQQLPSVGAGNVLRNVIDTGLVPVTDLREVFRQEHTSDIVLAAHDIQKGTLPSFDPPSKEFCMLEINSEGEVLNALLKTVQALYERRENFQVLSPRHAGTLGVTNLNKRVRELLNPKDPVLGEMRLGQETVREGDRVMVSRNNYRYEIFNGDVGKIVRLDQKRRVVEVKIHGPPVMHVQIAFRDAPSHLRLAYCVTVHKSQGQEYDTILMPLVEGFRHQLQRNLLYTGITRAKRRVILLGHRKALHKAIENNRVDDRNTLFADRLLGV
jgi:exodeoxyribonuclease V alpha subunit